MIPAVGNDNKKTLYQLLNLYVSDEINTKTFCEGYINCYDPNKINFRPDEAQAFYELITAIHLLAPSQAEPEQYPDVYISDKKLKEIALDIKKTLQHYYKQYNIGHQCFFCNTPIMSSHTDPCRMHVKIPLKKALQCHQYFFCHVACVEKRVTLKAYFDLPYLGDYEENENSEGVDMNGKIIPDCICCFCERKISCYGSTEANQDVCSLTFISNIDKEKNKQHKNSMCCHLECLKKQTTPIIAAQLSHFECDHP